MLNSVPFLCYWTHHARRTRLYFASPEIRWHTSFATSSDKIKFSVHIQRVALPRFSDTGFKHSKTLRVLSPFWKDMKDHMYLYHYVETTFWTLLTRHATWNSFTYCNYTEKGHSRKKKVVWLANKYSNLPESVNFNSSFTTGFCLGSAESYSCFT